MELRWIQQQTLANGASVLRFQTSVETLWQPGDRLRFCELELELPIMRSDNQWLECVQPACITQNWRADYDYPVEPLYQQRWQRPNSDRVLLLGDEQGLATVLHAAQLWFRQNSQALVLLQLSVPTPFQLRPSQFMVQGLPPGVIAAAPLLEDWGIASRIVSTEFQPGCFQGELFELAQHWLASQEEEVTLLAAGTETLRDNLGKLGEFQFSQQD